MHGGGEICESASCGIRPDCTAYVEVAQDPDPKNLASSDQPVIHLTGHCAVPDGPHWDRADGQKQIRRDLRPAVLYNVSAS